MGVLANHVPSIEQLKPGLIEVIEESGSSKQFFRTCYPTIGARIREKDAAVRCWIAQHRQPAWSR